MPNPFDRFDRRPGGQGSVVFADPFKARSADREDRQIGISAANLALSQAREAREAQGQTTGTLPTGYRWADAAHTKQEIIPGGPADTGGDSATGGQSEQATVRALVDGRMAFPSGAALRNPYWQNMLAKVAQADPNFDAVNYNARAATRKDFTSGASAKNITAFNTALGHLGTLYQASVDLNNRSFTPWNSVANAVERTAGDPRVDKFNAARQAAVDELEKAFRGSNGTQAGINEWKNSINSSQSPQQLRSVIGQMVDLLGSRVNALGEQYKQGMGKSIDGLTLLDPHAQAVFSALGPNGTGQIGKPPKDNNPLTGGSGLLSGPSGSGPDGPPPGGGASPDQPGLSPTGGNTRTFYTERDRALADEYQAAFAKGATRAQLDAIAGKYGAVSPPDVDKAIAYRDKTGNVSQQFVAKPTGHEEVGLTGAVANAIPGKAGSYAAGVANSLTFGQLDHLAQATGSSVGGTALAENLAKQNGLSYLAGAVTGDAIGGVGMRKGLSLVADALPEAHAAASTLRNPFAADTAFGAAQGTGQSDGSVGGLVLGGLLGAGGNVAGSYVGKRIGSLRTPVGADPLNRGERSIIKAVDETGRDSVVDALSQARDLAVPASLADVSPQVNSLTGAAIRRSPTVAGQAREALIPRNRGQYDRVVEALSRDLGPVTNVPQTSQDLMAQARTAAAPLYEKAYAAPAVGSPELDSLLATPAGGQALNRARMIAANERRNPAELGFSVNVNGDVNLTPVRMDLYSAQAQARSGLQDAQQALKAARAPGVDRDAAIARVESARQAVREADAALMGAPSAGVAATSPQFSPQTLDYVKRGIDDVIEGLPKGMNGRPIMDENYRAVDGVRRQLLNELDTLNPDYAAARAAYAGPASSKEALNMGVDAINMAPNELGVLASNQSPERLSQMQLGFRSGLADKAATLRYQTNPFESVLGTPAMEQRLSTLYGNTPEVARLLAQRDLEGQLAASSNRLVGNSMTAERGVADAEFATSPVVEGLLHAGAAVATHGASVPGTAARLAGAGIKDRIALGLGRSATQKAEQIAPIALDTNPQSAADALADLYRRQQEYTVAKALLGERARNPGSVVGMGLATSALPFYSQ